MGCSFWLVSIDLELACVLTAAPILQAPSELLLCVSLPAFLVCVCITQLTLAHSVTRLDRPVSHPNDHRVPITHVPTLLAAEVRVCMSKTAQPWHRLQV